MKNTADCRASVELAGPIAWLTLTRADKANALDRRMIDRLLTLLDEIETSPQAKALIIRGDGRNFCAGADLDEFLAGGADRLRPFLERLCELTNRLEHSHLVTIAAVHGAVRAGGLELALACDAVVAARSATFGDAHLAHNLLPGGGSSVRLPRCVGWNRAKWLILSAEAIDARTARDWGLALEVLEDADLEAGAERCANALTRASPATVRRAKRQLAMVSEQPHSAALESEIASLEAHYHSESLQSGVRDFLSRRKR